MLLGNTTGHWPLVAICIVANWPTPLNHPVRQLRAIYATFGRIGQVGRMQSGPLTPKNRHATHYAKVANLTHSAHWLSDMAGQLVPFTRHSAELD